MGGTSLRSTPLLQEPPEDLSRRKALALLPKKERDALIRKYAKAAGLSVKEWIVTFANDWRFVGRPKQIAPLTDEGGWMFFFMRAGRGWGKTAAGSHWVREKALASKVRVALISRTLYDVRQTQVEGETGLLSVFADHELRGGSRESAWNRGSCELWLANGSYVRGFSSEKPDALRGPNNNYVWGDEVSSWDDAKVGDALGSTFSMLKLTLRHGAHPQVLLTSTPKANKLTKEILAIDPKVLRLVHGSSYENRDNLPEVYWDAVVRPYEGTRLGRQEIHAELLEDVEGALWTQAQIDALRVTKAPDLQRIIVAVDPNASSDSAANDAGIIVAGRSSDRQGYVLADRTITRGGPRAWARAAVDAYHEFGADRIVAEKNNGGEMVELTIHTVDDKVPVKLVSASRGKRTRAEPVASLYEGDPEKGNPPRIHHVGAFPELEEQMGTWTPDADSPDRMDALVWAFTELLLGGSGQISTHVPRGRIPARVR